MKHLHIFAAMLVFLGMTACSNNNPEESKPEDPKGADSALVVSPLMINAPAEGGEFTLEVTSRVKWSVSSSASWVKYNPGVGRQNGTVTITIEPNKIDNVTTATVTIAEYGTDENENKLEVDVAVTRAAYVIVEGSLNGLFSVSTDEKVRFSKGNLQYNAGTDTWRFAEHQYDCIGQDNQNISGTYSGWIDLFGWGTGDNPTNASISNADYTVFTEWGTNIISNGGNKTKLWRTLTIEEWEYLCYGRSNASRLRGYATIDSVHGYVFLPDSWSWSDELSFLPSAADWTTNYYSDDTWQPLEQNGAVFLPAAGYRWGTTIKALDTYGYYWSSSYDTIEEGAYAFGYYMNLYDPIMYDNPYFGHSVRLVR